MSCEKRNPFLCEDGNLRMPGLRLGDFQLNGSWLSSWKIASLMMSAAHEATVLNSQLPDGSLHFTITQCLKVSKKFYELNGQRSLLDFSFQNSYIGRTSYQIAIKVMNEGEILAEIRTVNVRVDKTSHEPKPIPLQWAEKFKSSMYESTKPDRIELIEKPPSVRSFVSTAKCLWSDVDFNGHMNDVSYVRHCLEVASDAASQCYFTKLSGNMFCRPTKEMQELFLGQMKRGEEAEVETWENLADPFTLHFHFSISGKVIYQNTIIFFDDQRSML